MCHKKAGLHSCGHQGSVKTNLCPDATLRMNPAIGNREAAIFDAACDIPPVPDDRDYCCDRKCCSRQIKTTYDACRKAGAAKADFPAPSFTQRSITGKPKPAYLAKKDEAAAAHLQAKADHDAAKQQHSVCRQKQDAASARGRTAFDKERGVIAEQNKAPALSLRQLAQWKLERDMRKRFGKVPEPDERRDSYFAAMPRSPYTYMPEAPMRRPPPRPPPIMAYGAPHKGHEYVQAWLPRIAPGSWSEQSRDRRPSSATIASGSNSSAGRYSYSSRSVATSNHPFSDEPADCIGDGPEVVRPRND